MSDVTPMRPPCYISTTHAWTGAVGPEQQGHNPCFAHVQCSGIVIAQLCLNVAGLRVTDQQISLSDGYRRLKDSPSTALQVAERELAQADDSDLQFGPLILKARALCELKRYSQCLSFINELPRTLQMHKGLWMTKGRTLQALGRLPEALDVFAQLYDRYATNPRDEKIYGLALVRALQHDGRGAKLQEALQILTRLRSHTANHRDNTPCHDKEIELALGRLLQRIGGRANMRQALAIFTGLASQKRGDTPYSDKDILLTLGRHLQLLGGRANMEKALAIFRQLRHLSSGRDGYTPCHDQTIELTLGRHLEYMGGHKNWQEALCIFTRLRRKACGGRPGTPCDDTTIELALGRCLERLGGAANLKASLTIFTRLRQSAAQGKPDPLCRETELALGRLMLRMGGPESGQKALTILTQLRSNVAGKKDSPCDDIEIELAVAGCLISMGRWQEYDALALSWEPSVHYGTDLCHSVRYFAELLESRGGMQEGASLLGHAIWYACQAVEESGYRDASCLSQLAHCCRASAYLPPGYLRRFGIEETKEEIGSWVKVLFAKACRLAPNRTVPWINSEQWQAKEAAWLQAAEQMTDCPAVATSEL